MITGLVMRPNFYQMCFAWSARNCLFHWLRPTGHILEQRWPLVTCAYRSDTLRMRPVRWWKWNRIRIESGETGQPYICCPILDSFFHYYSFSWRIYQLYCLIAWRKSSLVIGWLLHSWQKRFLHPGMMCLFCDYFYFISPRGLRTGCLV